MVMIDHQHTGDHNSVCQLAEQAGTCHYITTESNAYNVSNLNKCDINNIKVNDECVLKTESFRTNAISLYEKLGFKMINEEDVILKNK